MLRTKLHLYNEPVCVYVQNMTKDAQWHDANRNYGYITAVSQLSASRWVSRLPSKPLAAWVTWLWFEAAQGRYLIVYIHTNTQQLTGFNSPEMVATRKEKTNN